MNEKKIGLYDEDIILDDGHDTARELSIKENQKSLAQWREEVRLRQIRDKQHKATTTDDEKPLVVRAKEDVEERVIGNGV